MTRPAKDYERQTLATARLLRASGISGQMIDREIEELGAALAPFEPGIETDTTMEAPKFKPHPAPPISPLSLRAGDVVAWKNPATLDVPRFLTINNWDSERVYSDDGYSIPRAWIVETQRQKPAPRIEVRGEEKDSTGFMVQIGDTIGWRNSDGVDRFGEIVQVGVDLIFVTDGSQVRGIRRNEVVSVCIPQEQFVQLRAREIASGGTPQKQLRRLREKAAELMIERNRYRDAIEWACGDRSKHKGNGLKSWKEQLLEIAGIDGSETSGR